MLTARERAVVTALAETFFPSGRPICADAAAGVTSYVDGFLARLPRSRRLQVRALLLVLALPTAARRLESWDREASPRGRAAFALRALFTMAYVADPGVAREIGVTAPPRPPAPPPAASRFGVRAAISRIGAGLRRTHSPGSRRVPRLERRFSTEQLITGIRLSDWWRVLAGAGFGVSPAYLHRAIWVMAWAVPSSAIGAVEDARYGRRIARQPVEPEPIFILGHWRSGTTHLHNLLGRDPNHTVPTIYQVVFPGTFLLTGRVVPRLARGLLADTRGYDNVFQGWDEAAEDEIALAKLTGLSPYLAFMFPGRAARYERYLDFLEATEAERETWKRALRGFLAKVQLQSGGRRVVVKSCTHTARIRLLLDLFPGARFLFIHRNPFEVAASTIHMRSHTDWENVFQVPDASFVAGRAEQVALVGRRVFERYLEDRALIPAGNLIEVAYDELVADPLAVLRRVYRGFGLPDAERYEAGIRPYLDGLRDYRRNVLDIDDALVSLVLDHWGAVFDAFGYAREYTAP